jgi:hypothetical protein
MSTFSNNILTTAGKSLIAQATAANPIIYTGSIALEAYVPPANLVNFDLPYGITNRVDGTIVSASAVGDTARVIAGFTNKASAKIIKTCIVYGRLANDNTEHCIIACSDENASIRIPSTSEASVQVQIALNVAVNDDGTVTVTSGNAASVGDLERMVSCHKPGSPAEGVEQDIYGEKSFIDGVKTDSLGSVSGSGITVNDDLLASSVYKVIGDKTTPFNKVYAQRGFFNSLETVSEGIPMLLYSGIVPNEDAALALGSGAYRFAVVYSELIDGDSLSINSIVPTGSNSTIGLTNKVFKYGYIQSLYSQNIAPKGTATSIGLPSNKFNDIYVKDLHAEDLEGVIPVPSNDGSGASIPVGALVCVKVQASMGANSNGQLHVGDSITVGAGDVVQATMLSGTSDGFKISSGTYTALSITPIGGGACMMIRVS